MVHIIFFLKHFFLHDVKTIYRFFLDDDADPGDGKFGVYWGGVAGDPTQPEPGRGVGGDVGWTASQTRQWIEA
eukprot:COSAG01_NODE_60783_length_292_cov_15.274611_1_plen_72_part_10